MSELIAQVDVKKAWWVDPDSIIDAVIRTAMLGVKITTKTFWR